MYESGTIVKIEKTEKTKKTKLTILTAELDLDLKLRLQNFFHVIPWKTDGRLEENFAYDQFLLSQKEENRLSILQLIYSACHTGPLPKTVKHRSKGGSRICKSSFAACMVAIGAESKRINSRNVWINVEMIGYWK
jgi:hypothetical protein